MKVLIFITFISMLFVVCCGQTTEQQFVPVYGDDYYVFDADFLPGDYNYVGDFNASEIERFVGTVHKVDKSQFTLSDIELIVSNDTGDDFVPECMPPVGAQLPPDKRLSLAPRELLSPEKLVSLQVKTSLQLSINAYITKHDVIDLQMMEIIGGCRQEYAGEVIFLIFTAKEVRCSFHNEDGICESTEMIERECRSRVYWSHNHRLLPFFVTCGDKEYFALKRNRSMKRY